MIGKILLAVVVFLVATTAVLYFGQRYFIYPAPRQIMAEPPPSYRFVQTRTSDGLSLRTAYIPAKDAKPTLLFFHGNGDSIAGADVATRLLVDNGYGALLIEYRGYAGNPGSLNEDGLYRDGEAAIEWLSGEGIGVDEIIMIGNSLGSGPATEMALRHDPAALVLISGFASLPSVVSDIRPFIPAHWMLHDRYDNEIKVGLISAPILILHGEADGLVRLSNARRLAKAAPNATLIMVPDVGHELAYLPVTHKYILEWLSKL